ncbi:phosphopentomutase [Conexibacter sp. DBS9H8]|uniref:phosphopentomutase n=1 Tax=Conexibacter sp. DBS9H8 TaxID=2937801 RepID=UPI00200D0DA8|nr:phosphopentomutase [Conexibacter sp. DBS9H8]
MNGARRAFIVVIDACGVGALPDAEAYGDAGTNTLGHLATAVGGLSLPTLQRLGLGNILPVAGVTPTAAPVLHGRLAAIGPGKDSTAGHWGLMGVAAPTPLPTFPDGFPPAVVAMIEAFTGAPVLCNRPANGIEAIDTYGEAQLRGGGVILYTSKDSVLQIAAHTDILPIPELHRLCAAIRDALPPECAVGRVIARPFSGSPGAFVRADGRRDFSIAPPGRSYLEAVQAAGIPVHTVGKAGQLMGGVGVDVAHAGSDNPTALAVTGQLLEGLAGGLVFVNLVDTDQRYGHRHDAPGFAAALAEIDDHLRRWLDRLGPGDLLILTADHGVDVTAAHTDHTREYAPLLAVFPGSRGRHDGILADVGASALAWLTGGGSAVPPVPVDPHPGGPAVRFEELPGRSFLDA